MFFTRLAVRSALIGVIAVALITAHPVQAAKTYPLTVFAASSLTDAFKEIKTGFERIFPDIEIVYNFGSSSTLATQLKEGAPADVFASANTAQMKVVADAKRLIGEARTFAMNRLVLIVPIDNPAGIRDLRDLAMADVRLAVGKPSVPVRDYTDTMLNKLAADPFYGESYKNAVIKNFIEFDNVRAVSAQVALGEADAGLVYRSDVTPDIAPKVILLSIPDAVNTIATYPIAAVSLERDSTNAKFADVFIDYVISEPGQRILVKWNFISNSVSPTATPTPTAIPTTATPTK